MKYPAVAVRINVLFNCPSSSSGAARLTAIAVIITYTVAGPRLSLSEKARPIRDAAEMARYENTAVVPIAISRSHFFKANIMLDIMV